MILEDQVARNLNIRCLPPPVAAGEASARNPTRRLDIPSILSESRRMDRPKRDSARRKLSSPPEPAADRTRRGGASASLASEQPDMTEEEALRQAQPWP